MIAEHIGRIGSVIGPAPNYLDALTGTVTWLSRAWCGLGGHVMVRHFEPQRLSLQCLSCGLETPGWMIQAREDIAGTRLSGEEATRH